MNLQVDNDFVSCIRTFAVRLFLQKLLDDCNFTFQDRAVIACSHSQSHRVELTRRANSDIKLA
jgi:hypothetical protein